MKRFTETEKWDDPWFRKLSPKHKLFWTFICDRCDSAGVWRIDLDAVKFFTGLTFDRAKLLSVFEGRVRDIGKDRWWILKFVTFQCSGGLSEKSFPHQRIASKLKEHGLWEIYQNLTTTLPPSDQTTLQTTLPPRVVTTHKEEEEEEEEDKEEEVKGESEGNGHSEAILAHLNARANRSFRDTTQNLKLIKARLREVGWDVDGVKQMIERQCARWLGTDQEEYLRPETLFGKQKFGGYYDSRNLPVLGLKKLGATDADHERGF